MGCTAYRPSVVAAYTNDAYLRDAYRCLQVSHRDLWEPNRGGSGCLVVERYKDVYISQSR